MKKKIFIIVVIALIFTSLIYAIFKTDKISVLALGDSIAKGVTPFGGYSYSYNDYLNKYLKDKKLIKNYYREFSTEDLRTSDLVNMIKNNEVSVYNHKKITIQQALVKSEYITISVGSYDLYNHLGITNGGEIIQNNAELNKYFLSLLTDLNNLIDLIQNFTTARIIIIGFYNPELNPSEEMISTFEYLDNSYKIVAEKHDCIYISVNQEISGNEEFIPNENDIHINYKGHELIAKKIASVIKF